MAQAVRNLRDFAAPERGTATGPTLRTLAVGDLSGLEPGLIPGNLIYARFHEIGSDLIDLHAPDLVLAPVVGPDFDCFDLAAALVEAGFHGRFRAAAQRLPDPAMVRREVAAAFPALNFDVLVLERFGVSGLN